MCKISVIVPVYNAEATICKMVDSLLTQTFNEYEILLIDDGSTDRTPQIIDEYSLNNTRVRAFHKSNEGVAMARKLGVDNAAGEYSIHADADDWVEPNMLEEMYNKAKEEDADIVFVDYYTEYSNGKKILNVQKLNSFIPEEVLTSILTGRIFGGLPLKLIRHSLYKKYNASFYKGVNFCEDVLICAQFLQHNELKISYLPYAYYHYFMNANSITHNITRTTYEGLLLYLEKLKELLDDCKWFECLQNANLNVFLEGFNSVGIMSNEEISSFFQKIEETAFKNPSMRWKLGFLMVKFGFYGIGRRLLKCKGENL